MDIFSEIFHLNIHNFHVKVSQKAHLSKRTIYDFCDKNNWNNIEIVIKWNIKKINKTVNNILRNMLWFSRQCQTILYHFF